MEASPEFSRLPVSYLFVCCPRKLPLINYKALVIVGGEIFADDLWCMHVDIRKKGNCKDRL